MQQRGMAYGTIPGVEKPLSRLVQGTVMLSTAELDRSFALLDAVYELGGTTFDMAHGYGNGDCERAFGRWMNDRGLRDKLVLIDKCAHPNQDRIRVTPYDITADLHDSLARLKVDFIDLYLLHRDNPAVPVGPIVETLNEHMRAGKIGRFGGSNWSHERIAEANRYAEEHGLVPFVASSPNFSLAVQAKPPWAGCLSLSGPAGAEARDWYIKTGMPLITWSSLAGGFFSDRFHRDNLDTFTSYLDVLCVETYCTEDNFRRLDRARELAERYSLTIPQIATAYVFNQPLNIFAIVGCQNGDEFRANMQAAALKLSPEEMAYLNLQDDAAAQQP